jgi:predicted Ser/Thr protein kinase
MANTVNVLSRGREGVDTRELRALTRSLCGFKPDKELHKALRVAGQLIADDAKAIIGEHSKSIPGTIKVRVSKTKISVIASGAENAIAGLLELGNKGRGKSQAAARSGRFRHPVYGNRDNWVDQPMHPFLLPAAQRNERNIEALEGKAVAAAFREQGFEVT